MTQFGLVDGTACWKGMCLARQNIGVLEYEAVRSWTLLSLKNLIRNQEKGLQHNLRLAINAKKEKEWVLN